MSAPARETPSYDPFSRATQLDPYPAYAALLAGRPVFRNENRDFYALSRFADVQAAFRDWRRFSSASGVTVDELLQITGPSFLTMDPPRHDLLRRIFHEAFRPDAIARLRQEVASYVDELLETLPDGEADIVATFAGPLPVRVISRLMGLPAADEPLLRMWSKAILERVPDEAATPAAARAAAAAMRDYFERQLSERQRQATDDLIGLLVAARVDGRPLPREEMIGICFLLFEAGNSTTTSLISNSVLLLGRNPDERRRLADAPGLAPVAVEELLRYESPVQNMGRIATEDIDVHGTTIPAGSRVLLLIGAANRDPGVFPDPDRLDLQRTPVRNLAFGDGIHHCIGAPLARLEAALAITGILARRPEYTIIEIQRFHDVTQRNLTRLVIV